MLAEDAYMLCTSHGLALTVGPSIMWRVPQKVEVLYLDIIVALDLLLAGGGMSSSHARAICQWIASKRLGPNSQANYPVSCRPARNAWPPFPRCTAPTGSCSTLFSAHRCNMACPNSALNVLFVALSALLESQVARVCSDRLTLFSSMHVFP